MKRSGFKPRTVPMTRGAGLARGAPLERKSRMKPQSAKAKQKAVLRSAFVRGMLERRPWCEAMMPATTSSACMGRATDVHEKMTRASGGDILDEGNCICVCRRCHDEIHNNRTEAMKLGLLDSRYPGRNERDDG